MPTMQRQWYTKILPERRSSAMAPDAFMRRGIGLHPSQRIDLHRRAGR